MVQGYSDEEQKLRDDLIKNITHLMSEINIDKEPPKKPELRLVHGEG